MSTHVFVYGTLADPDRAAAVVEEFAFAGSATLVGLHRVEGTYPTLAPGGQTEGRLLVTSDLDALDAYEGIDRGLYVRVSVPLRRAFVGTNGRVASDKVGNENVPFRGRNVSKEPGKNSETNENSADLAPSVELYVGDPDELSVSRPVSWPDGESFLAQVRSHLREESIYVRAES